MRVALGMALSAIKRVPLLLGFALLETGDAVLLEDGSKAILD